MAEALAQVALTWLGKIWDAILVKVGEYLATPIGRQFTYMFYFNNNIMELEIQLEKLKTTRQDVEMGVDETHRNCRVLGSNVETWLKSVNEVTTEVERIIQDKAKVKEGCLNGWCPNLKLRYSLSRKAVEKTEVVINLKADGVSYSKSSYNPSLTTMVTITNGDFTEFESRRLIMKEIFEALQHDKINLIGIYGTGGVGKTTMVKEVAKRAKEDNLIDEVAMAIVGQNPDLTNVQACIADMLGLELGDKTSPIMRASLLRRRLLQDNKKVIVILDDIWADQFDLHGMSTDLHGIGFPLGGANKNFKMLYTSRTRDLWHDLRTKKEIHLDLLSEEEAWRLFREKAGDSTDSPDLKPIAEQIVNECGRLPSALVLVGTALSKKSGRNYIKQIWEAMLDRLSCARSTRVDEDPLQEVQEEFATVANALAKKNH
ncbi:hypothetical protein RHGRI_006556 [Rhododendron griersonianum]|uniref:NB-ARC domain-containing protein n=1 Tax=Rhododendron griersonianum TaxID=479676 RepID=A0AAV6KTZ0_9ERIC|nr:hypothetical protein RHGRI_006556 [Rhododendron griersonianum]